MIGIVNRLTLLVTLVVFTTIAQSAVADWPKWRGPKDNGSITTGNYPASLSGKSILWKVPLPGKGCSTPVVWDNQIYVTAPIDGNDALLSYDMNGKKQWDIQFDHESPGKHRNGSGANASPVTDGKNVYVYFKSGTLAAVSMTGKLLWKTNLVLKYGKDTLYWDHGTSPVLTDKYVIMTRLHKGESWIAAFHKTSGKLMWKVPRNYVTPTECDHGYATPLVIQYQGKETLLVWGAQHLTLHDTKDGKTIYTCGGFNPKSTVFWPTIATPVVVGDMAVVAFGRNDKRAPRLHGVKLSGEGDVTASNLVWKRKDMSTFVPTPVVYKDKVYIVGDQGIVTCLDPKSGKTIWTHRFTKHRSKFYASPLIANGKLYAPREDGTVFVADISDGFKVLSENKMGEPVIASPVPVNNRLLIRGIEHLYCIGSK